MNKTKKTPNAVETVNTETPSEVESGKNDPENSTKSEKLTYQTFFKYKKETNKDKSALCLLCKPKDLSKK